MEGYLVMISDLNTHITQGVFFAWFKLRFGKWRLTPFPEGSTAPGSSPRLAEFGDPQDATAGAVA